MARVGLVLLAFGIVALTLGPLRWADLPDPLATNWNTAGEVDHVTSRDDLHNTAAGLVAVPALALVAVALWPRERLRGSRSMWATAAAATSLVAVSWVGQIVLANHGRSSASDAPSPHWWAYLLIGALAVAIAGAAALLGGVDRLPNRHLDFTPPIDAPDTAMVSWSGTIVIGWMAVVAAGGFAVGIAQTISPVSPLRGFPFLLVGAIILLQARLVAYIDRRGLTVTHGLWSWPRTSIGLDEVVGAAAAELNRWEWRGRTRSGRAAWFQGNPVPRSGPGIIVDLVDGGRYAVSVDDAETAAAVLNREVARNRPSA